MKMFLINCRLLPLLTSFVDILIHLYFIMLSYKTINLSVLFLFPLFISFFFTGFKFFRFFLFYYFSFLESEVFFLAFLFFCLFFYELPLHMGMSNNIIIREFVDCELRVVLHHYKPWILNLLFFCDSFRGLVLDFFFDHSLLLLGEVNRI